MSYIDTLPTFLLYFSISLALLLSFKAIYVWITPYREIALIKEGNAAAACSLLGALLGFSLPLASVVINSVSVIDMLVWSVIALFVQAMAYRMVCLLVPEAKDGIPQGHVAHGLMVGGMSSIVGLLNAACLVY
jgi:putative membrane protein